MKIVVTGGAGDVGSKVVEILERQGHQVTAASRRTGVDVITGEGLEQALVSAEVVIDAVNSPTFDDATAMRFFETSSRNILAAAGAAGAGHYVALSIVGSERLPTSGYFRAKLLQEALIKASSVPFTILRSTQFFEFLDAVVAAADDGEEIRLPPARVQFIAAQDAAAALADIADRAPLNDTVEIAGPDPFRLDELARRYLAARADARRVTADPQALYFGAALTDETLIAGAVPRFGHTEFDSWLRGQLTSGR
ncbi:SDR family oxidoreductase [soil metagenome]